MFVVRVVFVLAVLVVIELAVLVPVIVTQRRRDESQVSTRLNALTVDLADRLNKTIASFVYNVVLAAGAAPRRGFLSQEALEDVIQLNEDPRSTPALLYFWVPLVPAAERSAYAQFYGFNITQLKNGTTNETVPVPPDSTRPFSAPYTIFVPQLPPPPATNPLIYGFDLLSLASTAVSFRNESKYLLVPSSLVSRSPNNYGFIAVAQNKYGRGYMFGRVGSGELLNFSVTIPRKEVMLAAYVSSSNATRQALFYEDSPLIGNATNLAIFNALPIRSEFYTASFTLLGETILVAARYSGEYSAQFAGNTWVILAAVLAPVCFLIDVIWVILALLWYRRKREHQLEQSKRREAQVMVSYVNHEIRNPLQTILGLSDLHLEEAEEKEDARLISDLKTIIRAAEFIEHIATDILDLRKVEEGKLVLEMSDVNVYDLLSGLQKSVAVLLSHKTDVRFAIVADPEIVTIRSDRYRLEQILMNFLTNAFKHTDKGTISLSVGFISPSRVRFSVTDTGKGIPSEMKEKMFQEFSQSSAKDATELGGFGLGLYLTKMLAQLLGGQVGFESTLEQGSEFWVDLPVAKNSLNLSSQFEESKTSIRK